MRKTTRRKNHVCIEYMKSLCGRFMEPIKIHRRECLIN